MAEMICYAIIFLAEAVIAWLYFDSLYLPKKNAFQQVLVIGLGYALLFGVFFLNSIAFNAAITCIVNALLVWYLYGCSPKSAALNGIFLEFALVGTELLANLLIVSTGVDFAAYTYDFSVLITMAVISKLLYLLVAMLGARVFKPRKNPTEAPRLTIFFSCLPAFSILLTVLIIYLGLSSDVSTASEIMMVFTTFSLLVVNLIFMVLYKFWQKASDEHFATQLSLQKEQADTAYYQALQEQFENQRILIHDIKNHLQAIDSLSKEGHHEKISAYIADISGNLGPSYQARLCADPILNMLLLRCANDCKAQNISFLCDFRDGTSQFMDASSITTLYGNLLSNALEAAADSQERQIELSVKGNPELRIVIISLVNSCDTPVIPDTNGHFPTTKKDRLYHGIGMKSINRIVKKYHGVSSAYYEPKSKTFHHIIQFPIE